MILLCFMVLQIATSHLAEPGEEFCHIGKGPSQNCEELDSFSVLQPVKPLLISREEQARRSNNDVSMQQAAAIPKIVHHIYKEDISSGPWPNPVWEQSFLAWKAFFPEPEFKYMFWSDEKVANLIEHKCPTHFAAFTSENRSIVRSDFSRYCILWNFGGIYADLDYEPLQQFYADLKPGRVNLIESPYPSETYQNSLMASPPHHPYWAKLMQLAHLTLVARNVLLAAGPQLLEMLPMTHEASTVHALSCNEFQRATHSTELSSKKSCRLFKPDDIRDETLKGIHWGTVSYWNLFDNKPEDKSKLPRELRSLFTSFDVQARKHGIYSQPGAEKEKLQSLIAHSAQEVAVLR